MIKITGLVEWQEDQFIEWFLSFGGLESFNGFMIANEGKVVTLNEEKVDLSSCEIPLDVATIGE